MSYLLALPQARLQRGLLQLRRCTLSGLTKHCPGAPLPVMLQGRADTTPAACPRIPMPVCPPACCRDAYLPGVQALHRSLRLVGSRYPLLVMYTHSVR